MENVDELTAIKAVQLIKEGSLSAEELVMKKFERIRNIDGSLNCFISVLDGVAVEAARTVDKRVRMGEDVGRLAGIPIGVKDNICVEGIPCTCGSRMLENFKPPYNATVIERIRGEGGIVLGKTNLDEFAMGSSNETSYFGPVRNPWDIGKVPGGSSGGSGAAVASGEVLLAFGSDTGGSIRCPASFCGVVGIKPTYGRVSRYGLVAYANSLEQIGPIARNVEDCALFFTVFSGPDAKDSTTLPSKGEDYTKYLVDNVRGMRFGVPEEFFGEGIDERVANVVWDAVKVLEGLGATYEEISLPSLKYALPAYYIIAMSEASSNLARFDGVRYGYNSGERGKDWNEAFSKNRREGFGEEVRRRIMLGAYALSAGYYEQYYLRALKVRTLLKEDFERALRDFDAVLGPTMPFPAFNIGEKIDDPLALYLSDINTVPANIIGIPAISVPCGFADGLPVGLQIMAGVGEGGKIIRIAFTYEKNTNWHKKAPQIDF